MGLKQEGIPTKIRHWCARAERSPAQVSRKLNDWGAGPDADGLLAALQKEGYVDAERFAGAFVHDHILLKNWGPAKVWSALRQVHGIDSGLIREALDGLGSREVDAAAVRALGAWRKVRPEAPDEKALGALVRKGFPLECARRALEAEDAD